MWLRLSMLLSIVFVVGASIWDTELQYEDAMDDFHEAQETLAASTAKVLALELHAAEQRHGITPAELLDVTRSLERPNELEFLIKPPDERFLYASDGRKLTLGAVLDAIDAGVSSVHLSRGDAEVLGLTQRNVLASFASIDGQPGGWTTIVAASASRTRDRRLRARLRSVVGVVVPSLLIVAFGSVAFRRQRRELELTRELALADVQRQGEERLADAKRAALTGTLAMGIAHEISTPLSAIVGRAEQLLARLKDDEKGVHAAHVIVEQVEHINAVIRGILDLAHGGAPETKLVGADEILRRAAALVEHRFAKAGVVLAIVAPPGAAKVRVSVQLFEHAIVNLLLNACDASAPGSEVSAYLQLEDNTACFVVRDRGHGISKENAARLFQPFFTTKPKGSGTGLGLAISNEVVKSHRGSLSIAPAEGGGTQARIVIPVASADVSA